MTQLKLIVLDVDGVLGMGEAQPFNLEVFARLADLNRKARYDSSVPAVTLNTGRPSAYVEAVMQAIDGWQAALYENGAGLYFPETYQFQTAPQLSPELMARFQEILAIIDKKIVQTGKAYWQPGKTVCYSLFAHPPLQISDIAIEVSNLVKEISDEIAVTSAVLALNIYPKHINKGTGLNWLSEVTAIRLSEMGGVGDSSGDMDFLKLVGKSAAPANAVPELQSKVHYVSSQKAAEGLNDILNYWGL